MLNFSGFREAGVVVKNVDITSGEVTLNLNEELFLKKKKSSPDTYSHAIAATIESSTTKSPHKKQSALLSITKFTSMFPEKVCGGAYAVWCVLSSSL